MSQNSLPYSTGVDNLSPVETKNRHLQKRLVGRLLRKMVLSKTIADHVTTPCWLWIGRKNNYGYGRTKCSGLRKLLGLPWQRPIERGTHRVMYELLVGPAGDYQVLHRCDRPACCNPEHLFLGTNADNMADKVKKGRHAWGDMLRTEPRRQAAAKIRGSGNPMAKVSEAKVLAARRMRSAERKTYLEIGEFLGVSEGQARRIILGERWGHLRGDDVE